MTYVFSLVSFLFSLELTDITIFSSLL
jgi:hypothetical protein